MKAAKHQVVAVADPVRCMNAAATDGVRSTASRISTLSETWIGMRKTLAETAIAKSVVSSHAAIAGFTYFSTFPLFHSQKTLGRSFQRTSRM